MTNNPTDTINHILELAEKATPGPWRSSASGVPYRVYRERLLLAHVHWQRDKDLIVALRNNIDLLRRVKRVIEHCETHQRGINDGAAAACHDILSILTEPAPKENPNA